MALSPRTDDPDAADAGEGRGTREARRDSPAGRALRRSWVLPVGAVVGALLGLGSVLVAPLEVTASSNLVVTSGLVPELDATNVPSSVTERDVQTHAEILGGGTVARRATAAAGQDLPDLGTTSSNTSDVIGASASAVDDDEASAALDRYVDAFLEVVSEGQRATLESRSEDLGAQLDTVSEDLRSLDDTSGAAAPADRATLAVQQQAARTVLVTRQQQLSQDQSRVQQMLTGLPVSVTLVDAAGPVVAPPTIGTVQRVVLGALLGLAVGAAVLYRAAFRPR